MGAERVSGAMISTTRIPTPALALVILLLGGYSAWQAMRLNAMTYQLEQARRDAEFNVGRVAHERLQGRRDEMVRTVAWLDDFYRSPDGLQRPAGLWLPDENRADGEAIAVWILDVYLPARVAGASEEAARQTVIEHIKATDEWQRRHPNR
jgi:hypothetical protein